MASEAATDAEQSVSTDVALTGSCYCGAVRYVLELPAGFAAKDAFALHCHCDSCRRAHAAPLTECSWVPKQYLRFTAGGGAGAGGDGEAGEDTALVEFCKGEGKPVRSFCGRCGTRMTNGGPALKRVGFFPATLDPEAREAHPDVVALLRATTHFHHGEAMVDLDALATLRRRK